ncbi:MAG TPA: hypothetical protein VFM34_00805 [Moraxellaceae bacterium]|nr:hypothetical protein [Moraxellaceae bacterium]
MNEQKPSPLPPEPVTTPAGRHVGFLMGLLVLGATVLIILAIWDVGDTEKLLKAAATLTLLALVGGLGTMALRR